MIQARQAGFKAKTIGLNTERASERELWVRR